ncbi:hypothetical protein INR49_027175 [Caranx melampygus]|nr:hypothetical protein INR49_027175 [Caranx melampygus]
MYCRGRCRLLSRMAGIKEQQFTEEKPLLPEQRGVDSDMQDKGDVASGGPPCPASPASPPPLNHPSPPSRPTHRWHVIARHWLRQTRRRTSGVLPESCEQLMPVGDWKEHDVETPFGMLHVVIRGAPKGNKPAILTYHDVGLNHKLCFNTFFNNEDMQEITKHFVVCHVDAPGQQIGASQMPQGFKSIVGIGVGAGAYILAKFALIFPDLVEGLVLLNIDPNGKGWIDWAATKLSGLTSTLPDIVLPHLFSQCGWRRSGARVWREGAGDAVVVKPLERGGKMEGWRVECNSKLDPTNTTFLKMADSGGLPQLTQPGKLTEAFKYFLQGMGYIAYVKDRRLSGGPVPSASMTRLARSRTASLTSASSMDGSRSRACTHSDSTEGVGTVTQTMEVSC